MICLYRSISPYRRHHNKAPQLPYITYKLHCLFTEIIDNASNCHALLIKYLSHEIDLYSGFMSVQLIKIATIDKEQKTYLVSVILAAEVFCCPGTDLG